MAILTSYPRPAYLVHADRPAYAERTVSLVAAPARSPMTVGALSARLADVPDSYRYAVQVTTLTAGFVASRVDLRSKVAPSRRAEILS